MILPLVVGYEHGLYLFATYRAQVTQDTGEPYPPAKPHQEVHRDEV